MDEKPGTDRQLRVDAALGGRLRERVEELVRGSDPGWRPVAEAITQESGIYVGYETVRRWAQEGGWDIPADKVRAS